MSARADAGTHEEMPLIHDGRLPFKLTSILTWLLSLSSIAGLLFGPRGWYDTNAAIFPALLGQDVITLIFIVPLVLASARFAHHGSLRGLLCWMGALFYTSYFYYFSVLGVRFNPLFPVYVGILTLTVTTLVAGMSGQTIDPLVSLYMMGFVGSAFILVRCLQAIKEPNSKPEGMEEIISGAASVGRIQLNARWDTLPPPVRRYLRYAIREGAPSIKTARLEHTGTFRTRPNQRWLAIEGKQNFTVGRPGFIWTATVRPMRFVSIRARDSLIAGHGNMLVKLMSFFTIADVRGPEIDQGSRLRWLAECAWFPYAFVGDSIEWETIDDRSARAKLRCDGLPVSAVFEFDDDGRLLRLQAERYRDIGRGKAAVLTPWCGEYSTYREFGGFRVPTSVDVSWKVEAGSFSYARFEVTALEYQ